LINASFFDLSGRVGVHVESPIVGQVVNFSCGSAALMSCLLYWLGDGTPVNSESELWGALNIDPDSGAEPEAIASVARDLGLDAVPVLELTIEDLRECLEEGITCILCLQAWKERQVDYLYDYEDGHYVVLVGMDNKNAYVMDPWLKDSYGFIPLGQLDTRWHNPDTEGFPQEHMAVLIRGEKPHPGPAEPVEPVQ
jgi:predicted double-glycine peptidase